MMRIKSKNTFVNEFLVEQDTWAEAIRDWYSAYEEHGDSDEFLNCSEMRRLKTLFEKLESIFDKADEDGRETISSMMLPFIWNADEYALQETRVFAFNYIDPKYGFGWFANCRFHICDYCKVINILDAELERRKTL